MDSAEEPLWAVGPVGLPSSPAGPVRVKIRRWSAPEIAAGIVAQMIDKRTKPSTIEA
jgi:hypothetical protein